MVNKICGICPICERQICECEVDEEVVEDD